MMYTFDAKKPTCPRRTTLSIARWMGGHAIYHDGWIAGRKVLRPPWQLRSDQDPAGFPYELYDVTNNGTQHHNIADS